MTTETKVTTPPQEFGAEPLVSQDSPPTEDLLVQPQATEAPPADVTAEPSDTKPEEDKVQDSEETDYKAEYEKAQATLKDNEVRFSKLENDLKAQRGQRKRQDDIAGELVEIRASQTATVEMFGKTLEALASDDRDGVVASLAEVQQRAVQTQTQTSYERAYYALRDQLMDAVKDGEGKELADLQGDPRFAEVRIEWDKAIKQGAQGLGQHAVLVAEVNKITRGIEREQHTKALDEAKRSSREVRKQERDASGVLDLDSGPASGGGSLSDEDHWMAYGRGESNDHKRARAYGLATGRVPK